MEQITTVPKMIAMQQEDLIAEAPTITQTHTWADTSSTTLSEIKSITWDGGDSGTCILSISVRAPEAVAVAREEE